jgi:AraC-like DNA-binding protein
MFFILGISLAFFLAFLLMSKKGKTVADKILVGWLILIGLHLALFYAHVLNNNFFYPQFLGFSLPMPLLHGPCLFFYTMALTNPTFFGNRRWLVHFVPALALYAYLIPFFNLPTAQKIYVFQNKGIGYEQFMKIALLLITVSGFAYVIASSILLKKHKRNIVQQFSYTDRINLDWLQYLIYGMCLIWITTLFKSDEWIFSVVVLFVIFIGYFGIKQVGIFTYTEKFIPPSLENWDLGVPPQYEDEKNDLDTVLIETIAIQTLTNVEIEKKKYQKSGLSDEQGERLKKDLAQLMETEKLFKNSELTLADLANRLKVHPNYLSQVINEKEGVNFYDYVNALRIEAFKQLATLPESKQYTLLSLAYDCGFNSKSSFNRYFKKVTDLSPSEFMRNLS